MSAERRALSAESTLGNIIDSSVESSDFHGRVISSSVVIFKWGDMKNSVNAMITKLN